MNDSEDQTDQTEQTDQTAGPEPASAPVRPVPPAQDDEAAHTARHGAGRHTAGKHSAKRPKRSLAFKITASVAAFIVVVAAGLCAYLWWDDSERTQRVPEKTLLDGSVDLSGLTRDEVADTVQRRISYGYSPEISVRIAGAEHVIQLDDVGQVNIEQTVAAAFSPYTSKSLPERCLERVMSFITPPVTQDYDVTTVCDVADSGLQSAIKQIAKEVDCKAIDAGYTYDEKKKKLVAVGAKEGVKVNKDATFKAVKEALDGTSTQIAVDGVAKLTKPGKVKAGQAIYVDTDACRLYFYIDGKLKEKWACSPGQSGYETPTGDWTLEGKDPNPTWINPHSPWSEGMAESIPASPSGPLGVRALAVSCGGGIYIHGTSKTWALGTRDSHGCVRLSNDNIVKLYDMVKVGIPIIIR